MEEKEKKREGVGVRLTLDENGEKNTVLFSPQPEKTRG